MYRLVVCDFDRTIATHQFTVNPAVRQAMQAVVDTGAWITICTGRGYQMLHPCLDSVVVNAPLILCNGGLILDPGTREPLYLQPMPLPLAHALAQLAQAKGHMMWFYLDDLETMLDNQTDDHRFVLRRDGTVVGDVADPVAALSAPPHKVVIIAATDEGTADLIARVQSVAGDQARVIASRPRMVEVILPDISKARGVAWVAERLGVTREETMAIGDGDNDIEMVEWAGLGVAMGNASPGVKAVADWIAPSVDENGVAVALRRFVLAG
jgi:Cof subfamily protein (haloacid dehalogenase superfamily)